MDLQPKAMAIQPLPAQQRTKEKYGILNKRNRDTRQLPAAKGCYNEYANEHNQDNKSISEDVSTTDLHFRRDEVRKSSSYGMSTPFRRLSIGSPVPCLDNDNSDQEETKAPTETNTKHPERYFAQDCIITRKCTPKVTGMLLKRKSTTPSIKVDRCESGFGDRITTEDNSSEGSCAGSPSHGEGIPLHSPPRDHQLLSPTHPPCRELGEPKGVKYYSPTASLSRSENSIADAIVREYASSQRTPRDARSPRSGRSVSSTSISVSNTDALLSPKSSPRRTLKGALSSEDIPKLDYRHGSWGGKSLGSSSEHVQGSSPRLRRQKMDHGVTPMHGNCGSDMALPKLK